MPHNKKCAVKYCQSSNSTSSPAKCIYFFKFPKEVTRCKRFVEFCQNEELLSQNPKLLHKKNIFICSLHFPIDELRHRSCNAAKYALPCIFQPLDLTHGDNNVLQNIHEKVDNNTNKNSKQITEDVTSLSTIFVNNTVLSSPPSKKSLKREHSTNDFNTDCLSSTTQKHLKGISEDAVQHHKDLTLTKPIPLSPSFQSLKQANNTNVNKVIPSADTMKTLKRKNIDDDPTNHCLNVKQQKYLKAISEDRVQHDKVLNLTEPKPSSPPLQSLKQKPNSDDSKYHCLSTNTHTHLKQISQDTMQHSTVFTIREPITLFPSTQNLNHKHDTAQSASPTIKMQTHLEKIVNTILHSTSLGITAPTPSTSFSQDPQTSVQDIVQLPSNCDRICCVPSCPTENNKRCLFTFPFIADDEYEQTNTARCKLWLQQVGNTNLFLETLSFLHGRYFLCNGHFDDNQFCNKKKQHLKATALPTNCKKIFSRNLDIAISNKRFDTVQNSTDCANGNVNVYKQKHINNISNYNICTVKQILQTESEQNKSMPLPSSNVINTIIVKAQIKRKCCAKFCQSNNSNSKLFTFPAVKSIQRSNNNFLRCKQWIENCNQTYLFDQDLSSLNGKFYLCPNHFDQDQFLGNKRMRLKSTAVPSIFPNNSYATNKDIQSFNKNPDSQPNTIMNDMICLFNNNITDVIETSHEILNASTVSPAFRDEYHKTFEDHMQSIKWVKCDTCKELFTSSLKNKRKCLHGNKCSDFSAVNNMDPGPLPIELSRLSYTEEQLIARIHPIVTVYKVKGQQYSYSGNIINFPQDVSTFAKVLPHTLTDLMSIITVRTSNDVNHVDFLVRGNYVKDALIWLKENNKYYEDVEISDDNLKNLPSNSNVYDYLNGFPAADDDEHPSDLDHDITNVNDISHEQLPFVDETCMPSLLIPNQDDQVKNYIDWPKIGKSPINEFDTNGYIAQAFPTLFPTGDADLRSPRNKDINPSNYFKHLLRYYDRRFATHSRFRFFAFNSLLRWTALTNGSIFIKRHSEFSNLSVEGLKDQLHQNPNLIKKIMFQGSNLRGTKAYWFARHQELKSMIEQIGLPTLFITLSAADLHWPSLYRLLIPPNQDVATLTSAQRKKLLLENPDVVDAFFTERIEKFFEMVLIPKYNVSDHWYRHEYQHRGSPHIHGLLWLDGAPDISNLSEKTEDEKNAIIAYYDALISTVNPDINAPPAVLHPCQKLLSQITEYEEDLAEILNKVQRHTKCTEGYCIRFNRKTQKKQCRFDFPQPLQETSRMELDDKNQIQFIPQRNDPLLNKHNIYIIQLWRANMDIAPVISKDALLSYLAKYIAKPEDKSKELGTMMNTVISSIDQHQHAKKAIQRLFIQTCSERDFSAQEVSHIVMGLKLYCSGGRSFVVVNFNASSQWVQVTKSDSTEENNFISKYQKRPDKLNNVSLWNTAKYYILPSAKKREKYAIVRVFPKLTFKPDLNPNDDYYKQQVLLHLPWRTQEKFETHSSSWKDLLHQHHLSIENTSTSVLDVTNYQNEDDYEPEYERHEILSREEWMTISDMRPNDSAAEIELGRREIDTSYNWNASLDNYTDTVEEMTSFIKNKKKEAMIDQDDDPLPDVTFTSEQSQILNLVKLQIQQIKNQIKTSNTSLPRKIIVQGKAGTGKSLMIHTMKNMIRKKLGPDYSLYLAPTGVAAKQIGGSTIQSQLYIPRKISDFKPLQGPSARKFQNDMLNVNFLIIDEFSMVGTTLFGMVDNRLRQAKDCAQEDFGGIFVYLFGDIRQLPPVGDTPLYNHQQRSVLAIHGKSVFDNFDASIILTQVKRQNNSNFCNLLQNISLGKVTDHDYNILKSRFKTSLKKSEIDNFKEAIRLYSTRDQVHDYNMTILKSLQCPVTKNAVPIARIPAKHNNTLAKKGTTEDGEGLEPVLYLSKGARIMLRSNLWTKNGLVNGALGTILDIVYHPTNSSPDTAPAVLICKFDSYEGPYLDDKLKSIPIPPITRSWPAENSTNCSRTQFPVSLCYSCTIHKSQGLTLNKAFVDIGKKEMTTGLTYVALSRCKSIEGLLLQPFSKNRLLTLNKSTALQTRTIAESEIFSKKLPSKLLLP